MKSWSRNIRIWPKGCFLASYGLAWLPQDQAFWPTIKHTGAGVTKRGKPRPENDIRMNAWNINLVKKYQFKGENQCNFVAYESFSRQIYRICDDGPLAWLRTHLLLCSWNFQWLKAVMLFRMIFSLTACVQLNIFLFWRVNSPYAWGSPWRTLRYVAFAVSFRLNQCQTL